MKRKSTVLTTGTFCWSTNFSELTFSSKIMATLKMSLMMIMMMKNVIKPWSNQSHFIWRVTHYTTVGWTSLNNSVVDCSLCVSRWQMAMRRPPRYEASVAAVVPRCCVLVRGAKYDYWNHSLTRKEWPAAATLSSQLVGALRAWMCRRLIVSHRLIVLVAINQQTTQYALRYVIFASDSLRADLSCSWWAHNWQ